MARTKIKRRRRQPVEEDQSFIFRIEDWEPSYSFGLNNSRLFDGPYWEHLELSLNGVFLSPERAKDRRAIVTLLADRDKARAVTDPAGCDWKPVCVGTLVIRGDRTGYLGSLPYDSTWGLMSALSCGAIRMLVLHGKALYRGKSEIWTMHFDRDVDPDDW